MLTYSVASVKYYVICATTLKAYTSHRKGSRLRPHAKFSGSNRRRGLHGGLLCEGGRMTVEGRNEIFMTNKSWFRVVVFICLAFCAGSRAFAQLHCSSAWTAAYKCLEHCGPCPNSPGGSGGQAPPTAPPGPSPAEVEGLALNQRGVDAFTGGDYQNARDLFQEALDKLPNNTTIRENLKKAIDQLAAQAALKKQKQDADFNRTKQEALGQLKGISNGDDLDSGLKGIGSADPGLKDAPDSGGLKTLSDINTDPMVVDARGVPTGLPKSVDDAIVAGYASAPPGVSDRVRKAFQAIAAHDWKVARAWFQDALIHDPTNIGLKRMVDLADFTERRYELLTKRAADVTKPLTTEEIPADADPGTYALTSTKVHTLEAWGRFLANRYGRPGKLQLPADSDFELLVLPQPLQLPENSDIEFLFPGLAVAPAKKMDDFVGDKWVQWVSGPLGSPKLNRTTQPNPTSPKKP
jgi:hypothetical protein